MIQMKMLPNGARIVHEYMEHVRSAAVGFWVGHGSRHEPAEMGGASHAIEHMVFKGSETHSAAELAAMMDAIGGQVNAYTTKESTCFYAHALDTHLPEAIGLLGDLFFSPRFHEEDWELERGVIIEEIAMYEDTPEELVYQNLYASVYPGMKLGESVLGTRPTLEGMTAAKLKEYKKRNYRPCDIVVALAGHYSPGDLEQLEGLLNRLEASECPPAAPAFYAPAFTLCEKKIEQNHLCLGFPGLPQDRERIQAYRVLTAILGSGMSSRLFRTVREEKGLCYSVYSYVVEHQDTGVAGVYLALSRDSEGQALELTKKVVEEFVQDGPTDAELTRAKEQRKANILMSEESTTHRSSGLGNAVLTFGSAREIDDVIARVDAVTKDDVMEIAARVFDFGQVSLSVVGKPQTEAAYRELL
ncbi:MAG: insulinase family protein [Oscillospiraceae bacterium]|jgi:predicted Zn-dependent peptidase|nr:insulinase family protein [Oscillospiraceae bacterium]